MKSLLNKLQSNKLTDFLLLALIMCLLLWVNLYVFSGFQPRIYSDSAIYAALSLKFIEGDWFNAFHVWWQPLYPFLASFIYPMTLSVERSLFYTSLFFGVFLFLPIYFITLEITKNKFLSVLAGIITIFNAQLIGAYFNLLTENLYIFLLFSSVYFGLVTFTRKKLVYPILFGLITGVTYYARNDVLLPVQIFILWYLILAFTKKISWKFFIKGTGLVVLVFAITILPYVYISTLKFGYVNLSAKFNAVKNMPAYFSPQQNFTTTFAQDVWSVQAPNYDSDFFNKSYSYWDHREEIWDGTWARFWGYIRELKERESNLSISLMMITALIAFFYFIKSKVEFLYLHILMILGFLMSLPFQPGVDFRYEIWIYPLTSIFLVTTIFVFDKLLGNRINFWKNAKKSRTARVFIFISVVSVVFLLYKDNLSIPSTALETVAEVNSLKTQGEYIRSLGKENPRIMTRREAIPYYAKGFIVYIPTSIGIKELKDYAKLWKVDYIDVDKFTLAPETPLGFLIDETKAPDWLVPIKIWDKEFTKTIIYKVDITK